MDLAQFDRDNLDGRFRELISVPSIRGEVSRYPIIVSFMLKSKEKFDEELDLLMQELSARLNTMGAFKFKRVPMRPRNPNVREHNYDGASIIPLRYVVAEEQDLILVSLTVWAEPCPDLCRLNSLAVSVHQWCESHGVKPTVNNYIHAIHDMNGDPIDCPLEPYP